MVKEIVMKMLRIVEKHCRVLWGGGWCLEWLHPPPKGFNVKGERERERERQERERERLREKCSFMFHSFPIKGLNITRGGRNKGV